MKVQMQQQNTQAFSSVSNNLNPASLIKYGLRLDVPKAIPDLEVLTKKLGVHIDMFEYRGDSLKFDVFRGRFPYLKYLASRAGETLGLSRKPCDGYCYPGKYYFQIKKAQDVVDAAEEAITGVSKNILRSKGTHDI